MERSVLTLLYKTLDYICNGMDPNSMGALWTLDPSSMSPGPST